MDYPGAAHRRRESAYNARMDEIAKPRCDIDHPEREIECQQAVERQLRQLVACCVAAGWGECEVLGAIAELADNQMLELGAVMPLGPMITAAGRSA